MHELRIVFTVYTRIQSLKKTGYFNLFNIAELYYRHLSG